MGTQQQSQNKVTAQHTDVRNITPIDYQLIHDQNMMNQPTNQTSNTIVELSKKQT